MSIGKYSESDICILLREDPLVEILSVEEKEKRINSGKHYSEMVSFEKDVSENHFFLYRQILDLQKEWLASASISVVKKIYETFKNPLFISLARAGFPFGCLLKRAGRKLGYDTPHYGISIFRNKGIDKRALQAIQNYHPNSDIIFIDGWTGKGLIAQELRKSVPNAYLIVFADPCGLVDLSVTHEDVCLSFGMLNGAISGSLSRTLWNPPEEGYHRCVTFSFVHEESNNFLDTVSSLFET